MDVFAADIPLIRLNWVAARASSRQRHSDIVRAPTAGIARMLEAESADDEVLARGVMLMMAKMRLQIRHAAFMHD